MSFAAAIARANASVFKRLANARAEFDGRTFDVLFRSPFSAAMAGMAESNAPQAKALAADMPTLTQGDTIRIQANPLVAGMVGAQVYNVLSAEPDGTGGVHMVLAVA
jgi:hypothetical protein